MGNDAVYELPLMVYYLHHPGLQNACIDSVALVPGESRLPRAKTPAIPFRA